MCYLQKIRDEQLSIKWKRIFHASFLILALDCKAIFFNIRGETVGCKFGEICKIFKIWNYWILKCRITWIRISVLNQLPYIWPQIFKPRLGKPPLDFVLVSFPLTSLPLTFQTYQLLSHFLNIYFSNETSPPSSSQFITKMMMIRVI